MTLATHAAIGAGTAALLSTHPYIALPAALISHYILDSFPHEDYDLKSKVVGAHKLDTDLRFGKNFVIDLSRIGLDFAIGLVLSYLLAVVLMPDHPFNLVLWGAAFGVLPDALQFVYFKFRREPMLSIQKFHHLVHERIPTKIYFNFSLQALLVLIYLSFVIWLLH